jgi:hypothetical protein
MAKALAQQIVVLGRVRRLATCGTTFLRAERRPDGTRPFKLIEGEPLQTSYGEDLYRTIFVGGTGEGGRQ